MALALHSGITPERWLAMGDRAITTAAELLSDDGTSTAPRDYGDIPLSG